MYEYDLHTETLSNDFYYGRSNFLKYVIVVHVRNKSKVCFNKYTPPVTKWEHGRSETKIGLSFCMVPVEKHRLL